MFFTNRYNVNLSVTGYESNLPNFISKLIYLKNPWKLLYEEGFTWASTTVLINTVAWVMHGAIVFRLILILDFKEMGVLSPAEL
jgi:hypothetical protein